MRTKRAFTFIECLVGLAIFAILVALLIPAIQALSSAQPSEYPVYQLSRWQYTVYEIDRCEYIHYDHGLAHKGNCRFCEARKNKTMLPEKP